MNELKILNSRDKKNILKMLKNQFDYTGKLDYAMFQSTKDKIYIITSDVGKIPLEELRIDSIGLYLGKLQDGFRLSVDGSQLLGPDCSQNILELDDEQAKLWMSGEDLDMDVKNGWWLIKHGEDFLGCGRASGKVYNYVPKERRF